MLPGVYCTKKKDGTVYYRSSITFQNKHISLGSFSSEYDAHFAYEQAGTLLTDQTLVLENITFSNYILDFERIVSLINFRDNHIYFKTPIYLYTNFFQYYLTPTWILKFDIDDLFYYSSHRILHRNNHLYVNDYGMQYSILNRYGIKNYSVLGRDYIFVNGDNTDYRYSNIMIINKYHGVLRIEKGGLTLYKVSIHIHGNYHVGTFDSEAVAAIAYNKSIDEARKCGICKNFQENYVDELSPRQYADLYTSIKLSPHYLNYLKQQQSLDVH